MAEQIVGSLKARLSPDEKKAIDTRPTADLEAYDLYLQAKELLTGFQAEGDYREPLLKAVRLLDAAVAKDPGFALAYCLAARAHDQLYWLRIDRTTLRLAREEAAVAEALRLKPDLGEAHLARAMLLFHGSLDFAGARDELAIAGKSLPNSAELRAVTSYIDRHQGRWQEAVRHMEKAVSLDPCNPGFLNDLEVVYDGLRLYREEDRVANAALAVPGQAEFSQMAKAQIQLEAGQPEACRKLLAKVPESFDPNGGTTFTSREPRALRAAVSGSGAGARGGPGRGNRQFRWNPGAAGVWLEALVARAAGDHARAQTLMEAARATLETQARGQPEDAFTLSLLGRIDAALGRKEDAWREGRRAVELQPVSLDAANGPPMESALALIYVWTGETEQALELLEPLSTLPGGPTYGELHFDPAWDPLRGNPRFEHLVAEMEPK